MTPSNRQFPHAFGLRAASLSLCALLGVAACGGGGGGSNPELAPNATGITDPNKGGEASTFSIAAMFWGRLVDVYASDGFDSVSGRPINQELIFNSYVIGQDIRTDLIDFFLFTNPVTQLTELVILHPSDSPEFDSAFARLDDNLGSIEPKGLGSTEVPPFSLVPRNAAIVVRFSDLLDPTTISAETIKIFTGNPPQQFFPSRIFADPNHGGTVNGRFFPTRVILDTTVSQVEQVPGLVLNSVGLPGSSTSTLPNLSIQIPSRLDATALQFELLRNRGGSSIETPPKRLMADVSTRDVVRAARSGGLPGLTADPNNGFLLDLTAPEILGSQGVFFVGAKLPDPNVNLPEGNPFKKPPGSYVIDYNYGAPACQITPQIEDIIEVDGAFARVNEIGAPPIAGAARGIRVTVLGAPGTPEFAAAQVAFESAATGKYRTTWDPDKGIDAACFLTFSPSPGSFPATDLATDTQITVSFSEPMDPDSVRPFDSFFVSDSDIGAMPSDFVIGSIGGSESLREFRFQPLLPLAHAGGGVGKDYFVSLTGGLGGVTDLAGNGLNLTLPQVRVRVDPDQPPEDNGGIALRFHAQDEDGNGPMGAIYPEVRGQFLYNFSRGVITPRPIMRFSALVDRSSPLVAAMNPFPMPLITPLAPLGSRLMTVWRYADMSLQVNDETTTNIDVEGLSWAPLGGIVGDAFEQFEIALSHSAFLPDEDLDCFGFPAFPNSGLVNNYQNNVLVDPVNERRIVHSRDRGYIISATDSFTATSGAPMQPFPLNRGLPVSQHTYYTWRDTAIQAVGGPSGAGTDLSIMATLGIVPPANVGAIDGPGLVRSIGLPLLIDIKCFPDDFAIGLNGLDTSFAVNSSPNPAFRVFSTGGVNKQGAPIQKNPDSESIADGGFVGQGTNQGQKTPPRDNTFYLGQADFVTRISRVHTIWLDAEDSSGVDFLPPIVEPPLDQLPTGTQVIFAFRGATGINPATAESFNGMNYDPYGELIVGSVIYLNDDNTWKPTIDEVDGAQYVQVRITFISNPSTLLLPELSTLAIAFDR